MTPRKALARLGAAARGVRVTACLHRAVTKRVWLAERRAERLILRVDEPAALRLELDRPAELQILRLVGEAGVGPELLAADSRPPAVLLLRYVPGRAWTTSDLRDRRRLLQLADLLRRVHAIQVPGPPLDLEAVEQRYASLAGCQPVLPPCRNPVIAPGGPLVSLCHHDPSAANIVGFRRPQLIDWEYAAGGDPLFDLAVITRHHRLSCRAAQYFLEAYFGGRAGVSWAQIAAREADYDRIAASWKKAFELCKVGVD